MSDVNQTADAASTTRYVPPPKPDKPVADVASLLSGGGPLRYRNETIRMDFRTDKQTNTRRPSFWVTIPVPTWETVTERINGEQGERYRNYILDLIQDQIVGAAKQQVGDEEREVNGQDDLKIDLLSFDYLVNEPASVRRGKGIAKEVWQAFGEDYLTVMPGLTGKSKDRIANQVKLFTAKFAPVRTQKSVVQKLLSELEVYLAGPSDAESYAEVIEFLVKKGQDLMNMTEEAMLDSI